jgi:hypothetical protein
MEREADHSNPNSFEVQNSWKYTTIPSGYLCRARGKSYFQLKESDIC